MEKSYEFRKQLEIVHKPYLRQANIVLEPDELLIEDGWTILVSNQAPELVVNVAKDLQDYLFTSMRVSTHLKTTIDLATAQKQKEKVIILGTRTELPELGSDLAVARNYRYICSQHQVIICGNDERGVGQGSYYLEDLMNLREAPVLKKIDMVRNPIFSPRMVHSALGGCEFPDSYLNMIAHFGMDSIIVGVRDIDQASDINQKIQRAARFGLDVYLHSNLKSEKHPDDYGAQEYYENTYGALFAACPEAKGIILVGEHCEFPSRDPNTTQRLRKDPSPDGLPSSKPSPGWWPCFDYPEWLNLIKKTIRRHSPEAEIVFWTYNWGWAPEEARLELIRNLPEDITLLVTFEMFEQLQRHGVTNYCADYTISFVGPGKYFESEAREAKKCKLRLYAMSNTAGMTWDFGVVPYIPVPFQWLKRNEALKRSHEDWDLSGLMETHSFGLWPSIISELAKWDFWQPSPEPEKILEKIAKRDFGDGASFALDAWRYWSEAIIYYIPTEEDQYGPFRVGPSYPLLLWKEPFKPAISFPGSKKGEGIIMLDYYFHEHVLQSPGASRLLVELESLNEFVVLWSKGIESLERALEAVPQGKNKDTMHMLGLGKFILNSANTAINVKKWWSFKRQLQVEADSQAAGKILDKMVAIAKAEIANAAATIPLVEADSRLGWAPEMGYRTDSVKIQWKIKQVTRVIEEEIPKYRQMLALTFFKNEENY